MGYDVKMTFRNNAHCLFPASRPKEGYIRAGWGVMG